MDLFHRGRRRLLAVVGGAVGFVLILLGALNDILSLLDRLEGVSLLQLPPIVLDVFQILAVPVGLGLLIAIYLQTRPGHGGRDEPPPEERPFGISEEDELYYKRRTWGFSFSTDNPPGTIYPPEAPIPPEQNSAWLPEPGELRSLTLSDEILDDALDLAREAARRETTFDAVVVFRDVVLLPIPIVRFEGSSARARRDFYLHVYAEHISGAAHLLPHEVSRGGPFWTREVTPPWHLDPRWRELVDVSWERERPFQGRARLYPSYYNDQTRSLWELRYDPEPDPKVGWAVYSMRNGEVFQAL